jgi:hypothetical protein
MTLAQYISHSPDFRPYLGRCTERNIFHIDNKISVPESDQIWPMCCDNDDKTRIPSLTKPESKPFRSGGGRNISAQRS